MKVLVAECKPLGKPSESVVVVSVDKKPKKNKTKKDRTRTEKRNFVV